MAVSSAARVRSRSHLYDTPVVVVASKNYDGELASNSDSHLSGPLRVVSTNYDSSGDSIRLGNRWGSLGKPVADAVAQGGYVVASRTGDDLDHLNLDDLNAKKKHIEDEIKRLEDRLAFKNKGPGPVFKHKSQLSIKNRINQLKQLMNLLRSEDSAGEHKVCA